MRRVWLSLLNRPPHTPLSASRLSQGQMPGSSLEADSEGKKPFLLVEFGLEGVGIHLRTEGGWISRGRGQDGGKDT